MELTIQKQQFLRGLVRTHGVADRKSSMHILSNVLLNAEAPDRLRLSATDLYLGVAAVVPAAIQQSGTIAVSARTLFDIAKNLPDGEVSWKLSDSHAVELRCGFDYPPDGGDCGRRAPFHVHRPSAVNSSVGFEGFEVSGAALQQRAVRFIFPFLASLRGQVSVHVTLIIMKGPGARGKLQTPDHRWYQDYFLTLLRFHGSQRQAHPDPFQR